jgi:hypothetical protein
VRYPLLGVASIFLPACAISTRHPKLLGFPIALGQKLQWTPRALPAPKSAGPVLRPVFALKTPVREPRFPT